MKARILPRKGFFPLPISFISIILRPVAIKIQTGHKVSSSLHVFLSAVILILTVSFLSSCASDETADGNPATVCLRLRVSDSPVTRSLSSTNENTIRDITVLIFDSSSQLIGSKYVDGLSSTGFTATVTTRAASDCTVYAIANTGSSSFFSGVNTIGELNEKCATLSGVTALGDAASTIMEGSTPNVTISTGTNNIEVAMKHLCSKVNVSIVPSSGITVTGYRLCNTSLGSYITDSHTSSGTAVTAPANYNGDHYGNFDAVTLSSPSAGTTVTTPAYYVYENLAGSSSGLTSDLERTSVKAPTNAMYLLINAKTSSWHSTYRIYLGGMTDADPPATDYSNFNVYRNMNYSYTVNINGSGQSDARVSYTADITTGRTNFYIGSATIGDYLYADGTEGTTYRSGQIVGIIYSNELSADEHNAGYTHGKVLALKNANNESYCFWSNTTSPTTYPTEPYVTTFAECYQDITSGYYGTCMKSPSLAGSSSNYAWYDCRQYNDGTTKTSSFPQNSGWYLPSAGDWWDILANLGDGLSFPLASQRTSTTSAAGNYLLSDLSSSSYLKTLNSKLTNAGGTPFGYGSGAYYYWSSSECGGNYAVRFYFYASNVHVNNDHKTGTNNYVRAVLAF